MVRHLYVNVNTDMTEKAGFEGTLADFAAKTLNERLEDVAGQPRVINIESTAGVTEVHPKENNTSTWYDRKWLRLSVWYEV